MRLTETVIFSAYVNRTDRARQWVYGALVLDDWAPTDPKRRRPKQTPESGDEVLSTPIALTAGQRVSIRLEYASKGPEPGLLSLNWDSFTQERQRISTAFLYPAAAKSNQGLSSMGSSRTIHGLPDRLQALGCKDLEI